MNKILVDAFGGDNSPEEVIIGTIQALEEKEDFIAVFVGDEEKVKEILSTLSYQENRVEIIDAKEVITCEEEPTKAIMSKPNSTIAVAFKELKGNEEMKAFVSAGSTGAVLVGATLKLGRIAGVKRPALCPILPCAIDNKEVLLLDSGANADCKPEYLVQFAIMGSAYAETRGVENPKVALLSNGTEDEKGSTFSKEVFALLKAEEKINFVGNVEARDILTGEFDVIVTDGFSGNIALKSMESMVNVLFGAIKEGIDSSLSGKIGGLFMKNIFKGLKNKLDYNKKGGAVFLGAKKLVIKAHGSSKREAIKNSVLQAVNGVEQNLVSKVEEKLSVNM
jgi:glycerol-3-phosphate acyltransferase PlsX